MKMRYLTRLNMLGSLAFISILVALSLLYASGNFYTAGNELSLKGTGKVAEEDLVNDVPTTTIPPNSDHRLVVFGDAWSAIGSRLAAQGQAWPEWVCSMVSNYTPSNCFCKPKLTFIVAMSLGDICAKGTCLPKLCLRICS